MRGCSASKSFGDQKILYCHREETHIDVAVVNGANGSSDITVKGWNSAMATYLWNDGNTSEDRRTHCGGYSVTVTDAHKCTLARAQL